jgi:hypothetical protein
VQRWPGPRTRRTGRPCRCPAGAAGAARRHLDRVARTDAELASAARYHRGLYPRIAELIEQRRQLGIATGLDAARAQAQAGIGPFASCGKCRRNGPCSNTRSPRWLAPILQLRDSKPQWPSRVRRLTPIGVPSTLLQRRPDIAAAQQRVAAAGGKRRRCADGVLPVADHWRFWRCAGQRPGALVSLPNLFWAVGSALASTCSTAVARKAQVARPRPRSTNPASATVRPCCGAFQQVEDQLALLTHYGAAAQSEQMAAAAAQRAVSLATPATSRARQLPGGRHGANGEPDALRSTTDLRTRHRRAAVQLVRALGGGWSNGQLTAQAS